MGLGFVLFCCVFFVHSFFFLNWNRNCLYFVHCISSKVVSLCSKPKQNVVKYSNSVLPEYQSVSNEVANQISIYLCCVQL